MLSLVLLPGILKKQFFFKSGFIGRDLNYLRGFPGGTVGKESACNVGDAGSIPGSGRYLRRRKWQPILVFLPGKSHGQRNLADFIQPMGLQRVRHD